MTGLSPSMARYVGNKRTTNEYPSVLLAKINFLVPETMPPISYRQFDHWLRAGYITISGPAKGSGTARTATDEEMRAIADVAIRLYELDAAIEEVTSGEYFKKCLEDKFEMRYL